MDIQRPQAPIYIIIGVGILGLVFVIYWIISYDNITFIEKPRPTAQIISNPEQLPEQCTQTISLLDCIISKVDTKTDKEGLNQYYQRTISEWNIIVDKQKLTDACKTQYNYIQSIQDKSYQPIIQACNE